jgi:hypothetical protein
MIFNRALDAWRVTREASNIPWDLLRLIRAWPLKQGSIILVKIPETFGKPQIRQN